VSDFLCVYGTLRGGASHPAALHLAYNARLLGPARVPGRLYDLGPYPGMTPAEADGDWVHGEVYHLLHPTATLAVLDRYEGTRPSEGGLPLYRREVVGAHLESGGVLSCWVYCYARAVDPERRIPSGRYAGPAAE
jgi:gamma-glutamylcyclotransferase (GGCT)/AIG2-like uncharacterized protein YtfP